MAYQVEGGHVTQWSDNNRGKREFVDEDGNVLKSFDVMGFNKDPKSHCISLEMYCVAINHGMKVAILKELNGELENQISKLPEDDEGWIVQRDVWIDNLGFLQQADWESKR
jgi:hypothetical protein